MNDYKTFSVDLLCDRLYAISQMLSTVAFHVSTDSPFTEVNLAHELIEHFSSELCSLSFKFRREFEVFSSDEPLDIFLTNEGN